MCSGLLEGRVCSAASEWVCYSQPFLIFCVFLVFSKLGRLRDEELMLWDAGLNPVFPQALKAEGSPGRSCHSSSVPQSCQ